MRKDLLGDRLSLESGDLRFGMGELQGRLEYCILQMLDTKDRLLKIRLEKCLRERCLVMKV